MMMVVVMMMVSMMMMMLMISQDCHTCGCGRSILLTALG